MYFMEYRKTECKDFRSGWFLLSLGAESKIKTKCGIEAIMKGKDMKRQSDKYERRNK
jgi:hypothetical protein